MTKAKPARGKDGKFKGSVSKGKKGPRKVPTIPGSNPSATQAVQERRRSGAAGMHLDRRTRRVRTRAASMQAALNEEE